jgi:hypothetical protein
MLASGNPALAAQSSGAATNLRSYTGKSVERIIGALYIATGLICTLVPALRYIHVSSAGTVIRGAPSFGALMESLSMNLGAAVLIIGGLTYVFGTARRWTFCFLTAGAVAILYEIFGVLAFGWRGVAVFGLAWMFLFFLAVGLIVSLIKRRWITALVGSLLSLPFALIELVGLLFAWAYVGGASPLPLSEISLSFPAVFVLASALASLILRIR